MKKKKKVSDKKNNKEEEEMSRFPCLLERNKSLVLSLYQSFMIFPKQKKKEKIGKQKIHFHIIMSNSKKEVFEKGVLKKFCLKRKQSCHA